MTNEECLVLAPEPDAAALYCQHMTELKKVAEYCDEVIQKKEVTQGVSTDKTQHRYVVVDVGGGTVDITAQNLLSSNGDNTIEVIHAPVGNDGGGTSVNRELIKLVQEIVGEEGDPSSLDTAFPSFFQSKEVPASQKAALVAAFYGDFEDKKEIFGNRAKLSLRMMIVIYCSKCHTSFLSITRLRLIILPVRILMKELKLKTTRSSFRILLLRSYSNQL